MVGLFDEQNRMREEQKRMRQEERGLHRVGTTPPQVGTARPSVPRGARRIIPPQRNVGPQAQGGTQGSLPGAPSTGPSLNAGGALGPVDDGRGFDLGAKGAQGVDPSGGGAPGMVGAGTSDALAAQIMAGLTQQTGRGSGAQTPTGAQGTMPAPTAPAPAEEQTIMDLLEQQIRDMLMSEGVDTSDDEAALEAQIMRQLGMGLADTRASLGAFGMGTSGARAGLEADQRMRAGQDIASGISGIRRDARAEELDRLLAAIGAGTQFNREERANDIFQQIQDALNDAPGDGDIPDGGGLPPDEKFDPGGPGGGAGAASQGAGDLFELIDGLLPGESGNRRVDSVDDLPEDARRNDRMSAQDPNFDHYTATNPETGTVMVYLVPKGF